MAADTVICGTSGDVTIGSARGARVAAWSADIVRDILPATGYGATGGWTKSKSGLRSLSGSASGFLTKGSATDTPNATGLTPCDDGDSIVLTADTGCTFTFTGLISKVSIGHSVGGLAQVTFDFVSNGPVTEAWVVS